VVVVTMNASDSLFADSLLSKTPSKVIIAVVTIFSPTFVGIFVDGWVNPSMSTFTFASCAALTAFVLSSVAHSALLKKESTSPDEFSNRKRALIVRKWIRRLYVIELLCHLAAIRIVRIDEWMHVVAFDLTIIVHSAKSLYLAKNVSSSITRMKLILSSEHLHRSVSKL
jgi:hypothetical protein